MAVSKITLKEGNEVVAQINLQEDTVQPEVLFKGYTAHNSKGESIVGTAESEAGEETYTVILDCKFAPDISAYSLAPANTGEAYDGSYLAARSGSGHILKIPADCVFSCRWDNSLRQDGIPYNVYINNVLQPAAEEGRADVQFRGEPDQTYTIRMEVQWEEMEQPVQISAADCKFDDKGTLLSYIFNDAHNAPTNIILPSSYNMTSQTYNIDCRTNNLNYPDDVRNYIQNNNISYPVTLTDGNSNTITINIRDEWYNWEVDNFFNNAKITSTEVQGETIQYSISGTTIETSWGNFELIGTLNTVGSTIADDKYKYNYDQNDGHYRPDPNEWPDGNSYVFDTAHMQVTEYRYMTTEDPNWTITLTYTESTFSDGNDYTVTAIGGGNYSIFQEAEPGQPIYSKRVRRIVVPNSVTSIANNAFGYCIYVHEYILPSGLIQLGDLPGCYESLTIPNTVTSIGVLHGCLTSLTIPANVQTFGGISSLTLTSLTFAQDSLQSETDFPNISFCRNLESVNGLSATGITNMSDFYGTYSLKRIDSQTDGVFDIHRIQTINNPIFEDFAENVEQVILGALVDAGSAFNKCYKLREITFPDTLQSINDIEIAVGGNVTSLTFQSDNPPQLGYAEQFFDGKPSVAINLTTILVPQLSVQAYKEATNWSVYADLIKGDPNNEGHGPTPEPEPGEQGVFFIDTTTGTSYEMSNDGTDRFQYDNFYFEQGHEYEFRVDMGEGNYQGWNAGQRRTSGFPDGTEDTYIGFKENSMYVLQSFIGRPRITFNAGYNLGGGTSSSIRWNQDV